MKTFLSWSGPRSKELGTAFRDWLPLVIQAVKPFLSPEDIAKGSQWTPELTKELGESKVGLLLLTPENVNEPWIMFEAGALFHGLGKSQVCPVLFDLKPTDITGPLSQFQMTVFSKEDFHRLLGTINATIGDQRLPEESLRQVFDKFWPDLETKVKAIMSKTGAKTAPRKREPGEVMDEVLSLTREISRNVEKMASGASNDSPNPWGLGVMRGGLGTGLAGLKHDAGMSALGAPVGSSVGQSVLLGGLTREDAARASELINVFTKGLGALAKEKKPGNDGPAKA